MRHSRISRNGTLTCGSTASGDMAPSCGATPSPSRPAHADTSDGSTCEAGPRGQGEAEMGGQGEA
eukprot:50324-Chlamydomonas_euryale.AAC.1